MTYGVQPWLARPRVLRPWRRALISVGACCLAAGLGFAFGYAVVRTPDKNDFEGQPASGWLVVAAITFFVAGVCGLAIGWAAAPLAAGRLHEPPGSHRSRTLMNIALPFGAALVAAAIALPHNSHRWRPLWFLGLLIAVAIWEGNSQRKEAQQRRAARHRPPPKASSGIGGST